MAYKLTIPISLGANSNGVEENGINWASVLEKLNLIENCIENDFQYSYDDEDGEEWNNLCDKLQIHTCRKNKDNCKSMDRNLHRLQLRRTVSNSLRMLLMNLTIRAAANLSRLCLKSSQLFSFCFDLSSGKVVCTHLKCFC